MPNGAGTRLIRRLFEILLLSYLISGLPGHVVAKTTEYRVGVFDNRPIIFEQAPGKFAGISIDVLESIAARHHIKFDYTYGPWKEVLSKLEHGDIDLLVGIAYTDERAKKFDYTQETLLNNWGVVYRKPSLSITSLADLKDKRVALMGRSIHSRVFKQLMKNFHFSFTPVEVPTYLDTLKAVEQGRAQAAVLNRVISLLHAADYDVIETGIIFNPVEVRFAAPKGKQHELLTLIDKELLLQKQDPASAYHKSLSKWLSAVPKSSLPYWLKYVAGIAGIILLLLVMSNHLVRRQVARRTDELSESELRFRQLAENINEVFWIGTPDWQSVIYVSPAYERLWGQKQEELYANPMLWLESVYPEDQSMVRKDIRKKASGNLSNPDLPEYRIITKTGDIRWISARAYPIRDEHGIVTRIAGIAEDITNRKNAEASISYMAHHDSLTHLKNRFAFENELAVLIQGKTDNSNQHALLYLDLDQFKIVNDTCGHAAGDKMLAKLARLLQDTVGTHGMLARLGGDEFGVILHDTGIDEARRLSQKLLDSIKDFRFVVGDKRFTVGASIGLVMIGNNQLNNLDLLSAADMACYAAKERGRNRVHVYTDDDTDLLQRHGEMQWVTRLNHALEEDRLVLFRQQILALKATDEKSVCHEYLVRLLDEDSNLVMPNSFVPAAERFELMPQVDRWVIRQVFAHLQVNQAQQQFGLQPDAFINLSGQVFTDENFLDFVAMEAQQAQIDPRRICFEITETAAISNLKDASQFVRHLRELGFKFALDDFGTGMSSFSYLQSLQVDFLKIDGVFIKDLFKNPMNRAIVESITKIGHEGKLKIIAEWVESVDVLNELRNIDVDFAQGFAIDKPVVVRGIAKLALVRKQ